MLVVSESHEAVKSSRSLYASRATIMTAKVGLNLA